MMNLTALGNVEIKEDHVLCKVNPKIYPLNIIKSAAYIMTDRSYINIDGDPESEVKVEIRQKELPRLPLTKLAEMFNEQLLNYSVYDEQSKRNKELREIILQRVLLTNAPQSLVKKFKDAQDGPKSVR